LADRVAELDGPITGDPIKLVELSRLDRFELPADTADPAAITDYTLERVRGLIGAYAEALDRTRGADELTHHLLLKLVRRQLETEAELEGLATPRGRQLYRIAREVVVEIEAEWTSRSARPRCVSYASRSRSSTRRCERPGGAEPRMQRVSDASCGCPHARAARTR